MSELRSELFGFDLITQQSQFVQAIRDTAKTLQAAALFTSDDAVVQRRLAIYRGNVVTAITKTLALAYPVIQQVLGEEFFNGLARAYWQHTPSASGNLHDFGSTFAEFVAEFPHTREYPYLSDLARLEWAVFCAASAADAKPFDASSLTQIPEEQQDQLRFDFAPGTALIRSGYPIAQIWTIHQKTYTGSFQVEWDTPETAWVIRDGMQVRVEELDQGNAAALELLLSGETLLNALEAADAAASDFDISSALGHWIQSGWICDVYCHPL